jgi:hypothetical protein
VVLGFEAAFFFEINFPVLALRLTLTVAFFALLAMTFLILEI